MRFSTPAPLLLWACFVLFVVAGAWAQPAPRATPPQKGDSPLIRNSFTAKGLKDEEDLTDLFTGNFGGLSFDRGSLVLSSLFGSYLEAYWRHCGDHLPANKVEMTAQVCADAPLPPPRFGEPPPRSQGCMSWRTVSLGWADPVLYAAKTQLDLEQAANRIKDLPGTLNNLNGSLHDLTRATRDGFNFSVDMDALVRLNACTGAGLRRFQENLVLFSEGKPPLLLPGSPPMTPSVLPAGVLVDSDYNRLVEDLVADQAKAWTFNRYVPGSTSQVIVAHDPTGRPATIRAKYFFTSLATSGRTRGSVNVSFTDGMPKCIYFSDAPSDCQTPNRRIVAKYSSGGYLDPNASPPGSSPAAAPALPPPNRDPAVQVKAQAEASVRVSVCVPGDLVAEWNNPAPGSKMEALQRQLKADLRERAKSPQSDQTKWMTVDSRIYSTWNPTGPFRGVVTVTDGGRCAVGRHEFLALTP